MGRTMVRSWWWILLLLVANFFIFSSLFPRGERPIDVPYSLFREQAESGNVEEVSSRGDVVEGRFAEPVTYPPEGGRGEEAALDAGEPRTSESFTTTLPGFVDPGLEELLVENEVEISAEPINQGSLIQTLLFGFGPAILLIGVFVWLSRRAARAGGGLGGLMGFGRSNARRYDEENQSRVTFADVAGIEEAENELVEIVDFLKQPETHTRLGGASPKGLLLIGQPGTGKTLLAKAVAGEAGVPFFSMSASEFIETFVGVGASRVRDLFKNAREAAPAIIFIDELDAIGRARGRAAVGGSGEQEQTLNQILTEMDGFSSSEGVIVVAATNQPDVLDPALLRPGRFDRRVTVQAPDKRGREEILKVHTKGVPLADDADLRVLASSTPGLVGADLKNLVNEAALLAARRERDDVRQKDFLDALEKITLGPARSLLLNEKDRERVAYHEGGHAVLGVVVPGADPVERVTIVPRGPALGVTYQRPEEDRYNYDEAYLRGRIVGALGGRVAEEIVYGSRTTGAESDIEQVTGLARRMVTRWGMSEELGMISYAPRENAFGGGAGEMAHAEATARAIDDEVRRIVGECYDEAVRLLTGHRDALDALAAALIERETLDEAEILAVTGLSRPPIPDGLPKEVAALGATPGRGTQGRPGMTENVEER